MATNDNNLANPQHRALIPSSLCDRLDEVGATDDRRRC